jgi:hypothetical protein
VYFFRVIFFAGGEFYAFKGSGDMNGETRITFSSRFCSERGFTIGFSKQELLVAEADFLSFLPRLP